MYLLCRQVRTAVAPPPVRPWPQNSSFRYPCRDSAAQCTGTVRPSTSPGTGRKRKRRGEKESNGRGGKRETRNWAGMLEMLLLVLLVRVSKVTTRTTWRSFELARLGIRLADYLGRHYLGEVPGCVCCGAQPVRYTGLTGQERPGGQAARCVSALGPCLDTQVPSSPQIGLMRCTADSVLRGLMRVLGLAAWAASILK